MNDDRKKFLAVPVQEYLLTRFSQLLHQGYSFNQALKIMENACRGRTRKVIQHMEALVSAGHSLPEAFERCAFSPDVLVMIAQADLHGNLSQALEKASEWKKRQIKFRSELKKAVTYPVILLVLIGLIIHLLMQFVIPQFVYLFYTYDVTLPKVTEVILFFYHFVSQYVYGIFLFLCASIVLVVISFKNKIWQEHLLHFFIRLPGLKTIIQTYFTILFCTQLGYLLFAHISLYNALTKMSQNSHSTFLGKRARAIAEQLLLGVELSSVLEQEKWFVPELPSVVYFAEKNGQLAQQLIQYGNYLESFMLERWLSRIKWLEPMLLTVIGIVTAYLFVALFMPVFQLLDSL